MVSFIRQASYGSEFKRMITGETQDTARAGYTVLDCPFVTGELKPVLSHNVVAISASSWPPFGNDYYTVRPYYQEMPPNEDGVVTDDSWFFVGYKEDGTQFIYTNGLVFISPFYGNSISVGKVEVVIRTASTLAQKGVFTPNSNDVPDVGYVGLMALTNHMKWFGEGTQSGDEVYQTPFVDMGDAINIGGVNFMHSNVVTDGLYPLTCSVVPNSTMSVAYTGNNEWSRRVNNTSDKRKYKTDYKSYRYPYLVLQSGYFEIERFTNGEPIDSGGVYDWPIIITSHDMEYTLYTTKTNLLTTGSHIKSHGRGVEKHNIGALCKNEGIIDMLKYMTENGKYVQVVTPTFTTSGLCTLNSYVMDMAGSINQLSRVNFTIYSGR